MSTLKVNTLLAADGNPLAPVAIPGLDKRFATAWVNFNGTGTVAIRSTYNVASLTDNGVGDYTMNFATPMANANYVFGGISRSNATTGGVINLRLSDIKTTTAFQIITVSGSTVTDSSEVMLQVFGGRA